MCKFLVALPRPVRLKALIHTHSFSNTVQRLLRVLNLEYAARFGASLLTLWRTRRGRGLLGRLRLTDVV